MEEALDMSSNRLLTEGMNEWNWTDHVRNEEVLLIVNEQRNILHEIRKRKLIGLVTSYVETAF